MRLVPATLVIALALGATVGIASDATDPTVRARQTLMGTLGMNAKVLGDMAGGKTAFDAAAAAAAKQALIAASSEIPATFEMQASDPATKAKPEIWSNFADFTAKAQVLNAAATALDPASLETVQAGMGAIGGACADCHKTWRN